MRSSPLGGTRVAEWFTPAVVMALLLSPARPAHAAGGGGPPFQLLWGETGSGPGQFNEPMEVAVSPVGAVYVSDFLNDRVQQFMLNGTFVRAFGTTGTAPGQFRRPSGVALDGSGNVYVVDQLNARIQKFTPDGVFLMEFGTVGPVPLHSPDGIAVGAAGHVYVVDSGDHAIVEYDASGAFVKTWGSFGKGQGQFDDPKGIAVGPDSSIYVADYLNSRVQRFAPDGSSLPGFSVLVVAGEFGDPWGIAVTAAGDVYCSLQGNDKIREYTGTGTVLATWGGVGMTPGLFQGPTGIALDVAENVYIVDMLNNRVQRFGTVPLAVAPPSGGAAAVLRASPNPASGPVRVSLSAAGPLPPIAIFDVRGRLVRNLPAMPRGTATWDGRDLSGDEVPAGVYFAVTTFGSSRLTRLIVRIR